MAIVEWLDKLASIIYILFIVLICIRWFQSLTNHQTSPADEHRLTAATLARKSKSDPAPDSRAAPQIHRAHNNGSRSRRRSVRRRRLPRSSGFGTPAKQQPKVVSPSSYKGPHSPDKTEMEAKMEHDNSSLHPAFELGGKDGGSQSLIVAEPNFLEESEEFGSELPSPTALPPEESDTLRRNSSDETALDSNGLTLRGEEESTAWQALISSLLEHEKDTNILPETAITGTSGGNTNQATTSTNTRGFSFPSTFNTTDSSKSVAGGASTRGGDNAAATRLPVEESEAWVTSPLEHTPSYISTAHLERSNSIETSTQCDVTVARDEKYAGWQSLIDNLLESDSSGDPCTHAAIYGRDGSLWAKTTNFPPISPPEMTRIKSIFIDEGDVAQYGVYLAGRKYIYYGKYEFSWSSVVAQCQGLEGWCSVTMTSTAVIIGISCLKYTSAIKVLDFAEYISGWGI